MSKQASCKLGACGARRAARAGAALALAFATAGVAQAQSAPPATESSALTWKGITVYGVVDLGVQYDTHSAPFSDYFPATSGSFIQKNNYDSPIGMTSSNLSQSKIGVSGNEPLFGDWAGVFRVETYFNPSSGNLSDALKSVALNNGKALTSQEVGVDSSVAGQLFSVAYIGFASPTVGSFTFGRNVTIVADGISKYDPMGAAQAFSVIGYSGLAAGGGDTEDRRLDQSIKYVGKYGPVHLGAMYQFGGFSGSQSTGAQVQLGAEAAGFSIDGYYFKKYNAISVSALSIGQTQEVVNNCNADAAIVPAPKTSIRCYNINNSVSGTISDNKTYMVTALYNLGAFNVPLTFYAGYEHITFDDPNTPLPVGTVIIGGYTLAAVNNTAYEFNEKIFQVFWGGLKWSLTPDLDFTAAYYGYKQNSYGKVSCSDKSEGTCSGTENAVSGMFDYRFTKRFDAYFGSFWSGVQNGLANGYYATNNVATTLGVRFKF